MKNFKNFTLYIQYIHRERTHKNLNKLSLYSRKLAERKRADTNTPNPDQKKIKTMNKTSQKQRTHKKNIFKNICVRQKRIKRVHTYQTLYTHGEQNTAGPRMGKKMKKAEMYSHRIIYQQHGKDVSRYAKMN